MSSASEFRIEKKGSSVSCPFDLSSDQRQKNKVQNEHCGADPKDGVDLLCLALADLYKDVEDKACRDTVGDAVAKCHEDTCKECGDRFVEVAPINVLEGGHHHDTDHYKRGCGRCCGNRTDEAGEECGDCKADRHDNGGKTRTSACTDACGAFYEGRGVGRAEQRANGGSGCIREERLVHLGLEARAGFHCLFVLLGEDAAAAARADEGADGVKRIGNAEREDGDQHQRELFGVGEETYNAALLEDCEEGGGELVASVHKADGVAQLRHAKGDTDDGGCDNGDQNRALDLENEQNCDERQTNEEDPERGLIQGGECGNACAEINHADVEEADVSDENTDTAADCVLETQGNCLDDVLTDLRYGDENVKNAADKDHGKRLLPGKAQRKAHGVNKESVQSHAGRLRIRNVCNKTHHERSDNRGDNGCKEHSTPFHAGLRQNTGVYDDDVGHCEKGSQTGHDFGRYCRAVFFQAKQFLHRKHSFIK